MTATTSRWGTTGRLKMYVVDDGGARSWVFAYSKRQAIKLFRDHLLHECSMSEWDVRDIVKKIKTARQKRDDTFTMTDPDTGVGEKKTVAEWLKGRTEAEYFACSEYV